MGFDSRKETSYCAAKAYRNNPTAKLRPWHCKQEILEIHLQKQHWSNNYFRPCNFIFIFWFTCFKYICPNNETIQNSSCSDSLRNFKWFTNITAFKVFPAVPSSGGNRSEKENIFKSHIHIAAGFPEAKFLVPDWGYIVDSGIGLSYRSASLYIAWVALRQPNAGVDYIPQSGTKNSASDIWSVEAE
jgi:hypothetical protein